VLISALDNQQQKMVRMITYTLTAPCTSIDMSPTIPPRLKRNSIKRKTTGIESRRLKRS